MLQLSLFVSLVFLLLRGKIGELRPALKFTSKPPDPTYVVEGNNLTFEWHFTLGYGHTVHFANLIKRNGSTGGIELIRTTSSPGKVAVLEPSYKHRVRGEVSNSMVKVTILGMERSDHGEYILSVTPFFGTLIDEVTVIVQSAASFRNVSSNQTVHVPEVIGGQNVYLRLMIIDEECTPGDQSFWEKLKPEVNNIFKGKHGYNEAQLLNYSCGSIIVDLVLKFNNLVGEDVVISTYRNAIQNGKLGGLSIIASSIEEIPPVNPSTAAPPASKTTPEANAGNSTWIVVSVVGGVLSLGIIIAVLVVCRMRMKKKES